MKYPKYSSESRRLATFDLWPDNSPVSPRLLAIAGFFCVDENTVVCFHCGGQFRNWKAGDNPFVRHVSEQKDCEFAKNLQVGTSDVPNNDAMQGQTQQAVMESTGQLSNSWLHHSHNFNSNELYESYHTPCDYQCPKDLNTELHRLHTFYGWPQSTPVTPAALAKQGFFYLGIRDKVECAFCGGVLHQWEDGDDPFTEHQRHYPHCPLVRGLSTANIPLPVDNTNAAQRMFHPTSTGLPETGDGFLGPAQSHTHQVAQTQQQGTQQHVSRYGISTAIPEKQLQQNRSSHQRSLEQQVNDVMDSTLVRNAAEMGFDRDAIRRVVYRKINGPRQSFGNLTDLLQALLDIKDEDLQDQPPREESPSKETRLYPSTETQVETQRPKLPDFADEESRLSTFYRWPLYSPISPRRLAQAGFFYTYVADQVRCFCCEGGLKDWLQGDDPWEEHARWYGPECDYVIMNKGMDYIRDIRTRRPPVVQEPQYRWGTAEPVDEPLDLETKERKLRRLREERQCKVCLSEDACMVFIPCGHLYCCEHCANMLRMRGRRCPLCRALFQRVQRAFLA